MHNVTSVILRTHSWQTTVDYGRELQPSDKSFHYISAKEGVVNEILVYALAT